MVVAIGNEYPLCFDFTKAELKVHVFLNVAHQRGCEVAAPHFHRTRKRRGTAASRSPLLIAAALINEPIPTGRPGASPQRPRSAIFT